MAGRTFRLGTVAMNYQPTTTVTVTITIPVEMLKLLHREAEHEPWYRKPSWETLAKQIDKVRMELLK
jgi:hypothetical protein